MYPSELLSATRSSRWRKLAQKVSSGDAPESNDEAEVSLVEVHGLSAFVGFEDLRNGAEKEGVEGSVS